MHFYGPEILLVFIGQKFGVQVVGEAPVVFLGGGADDTPLCDSPPPVMLMKSRSLFLRPDTKLFISPATRPPARGLSASRQAAASGASAPQSHTRAAVSGGVMGGAGAAKSLISDFKAQCSHRVILPSACYANLTCETPKKREEGGGSSSSSSSSNIWASSSWGGRRRSGVGRDAPESSGGVITAVKLDLCGDVSVC